MGSVVCGVMSGCGAHKNKKATSPWPCTSLTNCVAGPPAEKEQCTRELGESQGQIK